MKDPTVVGKLKSKKRPQSLSNQEKGEYFKSSYEFYKNWIKKGKVQRFQNDMERVGVYCIVYSMLEDRLETLWWNYSYVNRLKVLKETQDQSPREIILHEWENKMIPKYVRLSGVFLKQLYEQNVIDENLENRLYKSDLDRRELVHRNMFFIKDLKDKHIRECLILFRILDKMVQKHKKENPMIQR